MSENKPMLPKRIGFVGFDGVTACHLVGPADTSLHLQRHRGASGPGYCSGYHRAVPRAVVEHQLASALGRRENGRSLAAVTTLFAERLHKCDRVAAATVPTWKN